MIQGIIFDCDGVLIDSWKAHCLFFNHLRKSVGLGPLNREEKEFVFIHSVEEGINRIIPVPLQSVALEAADSLSKGEFCDSIQVMPGLLELLDFLRGAGVGVAINTNAHLEVHEILRRVGLADYFELVVTASDVTEPKPSPAGAEKILSWMRLPPERVAFVGDSQVDQLTAKALGLHFWAYRNRKLEADLHISSYSRLMRRMSREMALPKAA